MSVRSVSQLATIIGSEPRGCACCGGPIARDESAVVRHNLADGSIWWLHPSCALPFGLDFAGDALAAGARL